MDDAVAGPGDGVRAELLLHSVAAFREIVLAALDASDARRIVEVGGERGGFTEHLMRRIEASGGHLDVVDPAPSAELVELVRGAVRVELVRTPSPAALREIPAADAYILDGDHNYFTVSGELDTIHDIAPDDGMPLVVLHDVGWPCARRDQYYRPEALPAGALHPYSYEGGVVPGSPGLVDGGFSGAGEFAYATEEGGPRNGVLTAVDDFLGAHPGCVFIRVPCIFGLGFVFSAHARYADELTNLLRWSDENPLLARLEENRVALYLRLHEEIRARDALVSARDEAIATLEELRTALRALADSTTVRVLDVVQRPAAAMHPTRPGLRRVLHELAGEPSSRSRNDPDE